jgi:hypothetical protein
MSYRLLFDVHCIPCSAVADKVRALNVPTLDVASLWDPAVRELFQQAGRPVPTGPALIETSAGLQVWTGLAMRLRLARILGYRRAADIISLLGAEARARAIRHGGGLGRRRFLGGAAAGIGAIVFGAAGAAHADTRRPRQGPVPMSAEQRRQVLASTTVQVAVATWGAVDQDAMTMSATTDGMRVVALPHRGTTATTYVEVSGSDPAAITVTVDPYTRRLRYYTPAGVGVVELSAAASGPLQAALLTVNKDGTVQPAGIGQFAQCMADCLLGQVEWDCIEACASCVGGSIFDCGLCAGCAGLNGISCAKKCKKWL